MQRVCFLNGGIEQRCELGSCGCGDGFALCRALLNCATLLRSALEHDWCLRMLRVLLESRLLMVQVTSQLVRIIHRLEPHLSGQYLRGLGGLCCRQHLRGVHKRSLRRCVGLGYA